LFGAKVVGEETVNSFRKALDQIGASVSTLTEGFTRMKYNVISAVKGAFGIAMIAAPVLFFRRMISQGIEMEATLKQTGISMTTLSNISKAYGISLNRVFSMIEGRGGIFIEWTKSVAEIMMKLRDRMQRFVQDIMDLGGTSKILTLWREGLQKILTMVDTFMKSPEYKTIVIGIRQFIVAFAKGLMVIVTAFSKVVLQVVKFAGQHPQLVKMLVTMYLMRGVVLVLTSSLMKLAGAALSLVTPFALFYLAVKGIKLVAGVFPFMFSWMGKIALKGSILLGIFKIIAKFIIASTFGWMGVAGKGFMALVKIIFGFKVVALAAFSIVTVAILGVIAVLKALAMTDFLGGIVRGFQSIWQNFKFFKEAINSIFTPIVEAINKWAKGLSNILGVSIDMRDTWEWLGKIIGALALVVAGPLYVAFKLVAGTITLIVKMLTLAVDLISKLVAFIFRIPSAMLKMVGGISPVPGVGGTRPIVTEPSISTPGRVSEGGGTTTKSIRDIHIYAAPFTPDKAKEVISDIIKQEDYKYARGF